MEKFNSKTLKNFPEKVVRNKYNKAAVTRNVSGECSTFEAILVCLIISTKPVTEIKEDVNNNNNNKNNNNNNKNNATTKTTRTTEQQKSNKMQ